MIAKAVVVMTRPRGYFGLSRDRVVLDGRSPAPGIPPGVAGEYESGPIRERIVAGTWPAADNHVSVIELSF